MGALRTPQSNKHPTEHPEGMAITSVVMILLQRRPGSTPVNEQGKHCADHVAIRVKI